MNLTLDASMGKGSLPGAALYHLALSKSRCVLVKKAHFLAHRVGSEEVTTFLLPKFPLRDAKKLREKMLSWA